VVAEGVETEAQMQFLARHHCNEIQGFWLSQPLEAHACLGFIRSWAPQRASVASIPAAAP
jgi:EAL domain-containing protein (putative c-di-GMP-specific phosphodiesterase class I)